MNKGKSTGNPKLGEFMFATSQSPYIPFVATEFTRWWVKHQHPCFTLYYLSSAPDQCK